LKLFLDSMGGGAWPFLVGGVICLVNSDNERDSILLNSRRIILTVELLRGTGGSNHTRLSNNRSVMPLDVLGRTRATLKRQRVILGREESG
jgi:hypothetical protein